MSSFGVVLCLILFLSSAYFAPVTNRTESKNEKLKRQEEDKSEDYNKDFDTILKKLFLYINTHLGDTSRTTDTRCETINEYEDHFMFYKLKGKIFPKRRPVYVAAIQASVGVKKYFEISSENSMRYRLKFNESQISFDKLKDEKRPVIEDHNKEAESNNANQQRTALTLNTSQSININTVAKIAPTEVTNTSQDQNINLTHFGYGQNFNQNISPSLQSTIGNTFYDYVIKNATENIIDNFTILHDTETLTIQPSFKTLSQPRFDSNFDSPGIQVNENVTESKNVLYSLETKRSDWDTASTAKPTKYTTPQTTSDGHKSSLPKNRNGTDNGTKYLPTTENYELNLTKNSYPMSFEGIDNKSNNPIKGITTSSLTDFSERKIKIKDFVPQSDSNSPTIPHPSTVPYSVMGLSDQMINITKTGFKISNKSEKTEQENPYTTFYLKPNSFTMKSNLQTDYFQSTSVSEPSDTISTIADGSIFFNSLDIYARTNKYVQTLNYSDMSFFTDKNKLNHLKNQSFDFTSVLWLNETTGTLNNFNISTKIMENSSTSIKLDANSEPSEDNILSTPLDAIETIKSIKEKDVSIFNYNKMTTAQLAQGESTLALSNSSNNPHQISFIFEESSTTHKDQYNTVSNRTGPNHIQNYKTATTTNPYYTSSLVDETKQFEYLTSEIETIGMPEYSNSPITEYDQLFPGLSRKISPDELIASATTPLDHFSNQTFYPDLYTFSSLVNNTTPDPTKFEALNHSDGFSNKSKLEISYFGLKFENNSALYYPSNNSPIVENTSFATKPHRDQESTNSDKHVNKTSDKEKKYSVSISTVSLFHTDHTLNEYQPTDIKIYIPESKTVPNIHESKKTTLSFSSDYSNNEQKTTEKENTFVTGPLAIWTREYAFGEPSVPSTTDNDLLTDKPDGNSTLHDADWIEASTTTSYETNTNNDPKISSMITVIVKNNSFNYFALPNATSTVRLSGLNVSIGDYSSQPGEFNKKIIDNHAVNNDEENSTSGDALLFYDSSSPTNTDWNDASGTQPDSVIDNSAASITETNEDEKEKNIIDLSSRTEKLITNNPYVSATIDTSNESSISHSASSSENVLLTTPLFVSTKWYLENSIIEKATTDTITMNPITSYVDGIVTRKNATRNTSMTIDDTGISVLDKYTQILPGEKNENISYSNRSSTFFENYENTYETKGFNPEWSSSVSPTFKPYNSTVEGYSEFTATEIQDYYTSENIRLMENTTQSYAHLSTHSKESDSVIIKDSSYSNNLTNSPSVDTTKPGNFTSKTINDITESSNTTPTENSEDIFKTTQNSIIPMSISMIYTEKNGLTSTLKTTTKNEITSEKKNEISSTSENRLDIEMSTQNYETMPSFNNFTFLLPTTDYLTSYLPVRIHPFIVFSEI